MPTSKGRDSMARVHDILGYEVIDTLGYGARSTIFLVRDKSGEKYALKRVIRNGPRDDRFIEQAVSEHKIAKAIEHAVIRKSHKLIRNRQLIRLSEVVVVMEYVQGSTLEQDRPKSVLRLCEIMREVCDGLACLHEAGFVHCDIKPNNIMVTEEGHVKIIDLGQTCKSGSIKDRIQGTPDYIAPEQVKRKHITPQTDIFNLGATLYWLLTNEHIPTMIPKGQAGISLKTESKVKPPREINPDVPPALSSLVMQCVAKEPEKRPASMANVRDRLDLAVNQLRRESREGRVVTAGSRNGNPS